METVNIFLVFSFAVAVFVDITAPLALAVLIARRYHARWLYWLYGLLVFLLFQGITRVPVMVFVQTRPPVREALKEPVWFWPFLLFAAATAGLFEEGGRWLAFRFVIPREERRWRTSLMLGAGHGGLESIAVGLAALATLVAYLVVTLVPAETFSGYAEQIDQAKKYFAGVPSWVPLLGGWERLGALAIQVGLSVMVLQAFLRGPRWWWYALAAHTIVDFTTVGLLHIVEKNWQRTAGMLATEALVGVYGLLALWFIAAMRQEHLAPE